MPRMSQIIWVRQTSGRGHIDHTERILHASMLDEEKPQIVADHLYATDIWTRAYRPHRKNIACIHVGRRKASDCRRSFVCDRHLDEGISTTPKEYCMHPCWTKKSLRLSQIICMRQTSGRGHIDHTKRILHASMLDEEKPQIVADH